MREPQDPVTNQRPSKRESTTLRFFFCLYLFMDAIFAALTLPPRLTSPHSLLSICGIIVLQKLALRTAQPPCPSPRGL